MGKRLEGKIAVVTGSTSGIGAGIAQAMAAEGAAVVVSGRRAAEGDLVVAAITDAGGRALFQQTDISDAEDCRRLCRRAEEEYGGLDILVNNAGIFPRMDFLDVTPEFWDRVFSTNVRGAFFCAQAAVPPMRQRGGGSIISIGSMHAFGTYERMLTYGCSKSALYALTVNLARLLAPDHIRVNWVGVGWVITEKEREVQAGEGRDAQVLASREAEMPMGTFSSVEDVARACVYLASDETALITGSNLNTGAGLGIYF